MRRSLGTALVQFLRRMMPARLTNRYRPELHYMRGPGPKSQGQGGQLAVDGQRVGTSLSNCGSSPEN